MAKEKVKKYTAKERQEDMLKELQEKEYCTYEYFQEKYGIGERSMKADIKFLNNQGFAIKGQKGKGYSLKNKEAVSDKVYCEPSNAQQIRKLLIALIIKEKKRGMTQKEILERLNFYAQDSACSEDTLRTALKEMVDSGQLVNEKNWGLDSDVDCYYVSDSAPLQMQMKEEEARNLLDLLETCATGHPYENTLAEIAQNLRIALQEKKSEKLSDKNEPVSYVAYHKSYETAQKMEELLKRFAGCAYEHKMVEIIYKEKTFLFSTGNVVYSMDKDKLYFLGERKGSKMVLDAEQIISMKETERENTVFRNSFYMSIVDTMFSISVDLPVHVIVEFDDVFKIREKVEQMQKNRVARKPGSNGRLMTIAKFYPVNSKNNGHDVWRYEDDISGLSDFANYLRRFGSHCRVVEPESLKQMMHDSALRVLRAYEELEGQS